jgi:hypothetical protein
MADYVVIYLRVSIYNLLPYIDYMLLKARHVSVTQYHLQSCAILEGNYTIDICGNKILKISGSKFLIKD